MNARLYDPKLHRFLQPDNFIQDPTNTQNFNRYGYVLNNPLKYTDPSGELFGLDDFAAAVIIGAVIAALTYTVTAMATHTPFTIGGLIQSSAIGAFSGAVTFGVSQWTNTICGFTNNAVGFWQGAFMGGVNGFTTGVSSSVLGSVINGGSIKIMTLVNAGLIGTFVGGAIGGLQGGANAKDMGLDYWSGKGTHTDLFECTASTTSGQKYSNSAEMRKDYNTNIGAKDGLSLEQVESKLNTSVTLGDKSNLPNGWSVNDEGLLTNGNKVAAGITNTHYSGGAFNKVIGSDIQMAPGIKGFGLNLRNMIFKHEFMHAWHLNMHFRGYNTYTERATSAYSYKFCMEYGYYNYFPNYYTKLGYYPSEYSWRNFNKIIPIWPK